MSALTRIPVVVRDGKRAPGHWVLIALLATVLIAYLWLVWASGATTALILVVVWGVAAVPLFLAAYGRSGSVPLRRLALLIAPLTIVLTASAQLAESVALVTLATALAVAVPCYATYRVIRRVYIARPPEAGEGRRGRRREIVAFAGLVTVSAAFVFPETSAVAVTTGKEDPTFLSSHAGCYALHLGPWRPSIMLGHSHRGIVPPAIRLDTARGEPFAPDDTTSRKWWHRREPGRLLIRPGHGRMSAYWYPVDARTINLVWTTGHHGVRMALQNKEIGYTGLANAFTDVVMPGLRNPRAKVRAEPVDCSAVRYDSARLSPLSLPRGR